MRRGERGSERVRSRRAPHADQRGLEIIGREPGVLGKPAQGDGPELLVIVKREHDVRPALALEGAVRASLTDFDPAHPQERGKHAPRPRGPPLRHRPYAARDSTKDTPLWLAKSLEGSSSSCS